MVLSSLGTSVANVALPSLAQAFNASFGQVEWVVLAYLLAVTTLIVGVGRLGDIVGRRRLLLVGMGWFTLASGLCGIAPNLWLLVAARAAQGLGAAIMMALSIALVGEIAAQGKTGIAMGLLGAMSAIGTALGPSLGGFLIAGFGWRAIFLVSLPLGLLAWGIAYRAIPRDPCRVRTPRSSFDALGTVLLALALGAYALAMTSGHGRFDLQTQALLLAAGIGAGFFMLAQSKARAPLIPLALFRNAALSASLATNLLVSTVMMATLVIGPFYLSIAQGLNGAAIGLTMSLGPIISALSGVPSGRLVDRFGARPIVIAGLLAMAAGSFALSQLPALLGLTGYLAAIVVLTPGYALFQAANNTAVMSNISVDQRGVVAAVLSLSRNLGLITGASLMGTVFAVASRTTEITTASPAAVATGMTITFAVATALVVLALAITLAAGNKRVGR